jgi:hypothetical protein
MAWVAMMIAAVARVVPVGAAPLNAAGQSAWSNPLPLFAP